MNQNTLEHSAAKVHKNFQTHDRREVVKNEFLDGKLVPRPAANRWHNLILTNFVISVGSRIQRGKCELYAGDMQVMVGPNSICFPDVVVISGDPDFTDQRAEILRNPTVVVEIFSNVSKSSDRTQKLEGFLANPAIKECLLINESEMRIEHYARQNPKQWVYRIYNERDDVISLDSIQCKVSLSDIYSQVKLRDAEFSSRAVN